MCESEDETVLEGRSMTEYTYVEHDFEPIYDEHSRILILGTLPSVKSRKMQFYYGHPQNRFWKVIALICNESVPQTIEEKKALLLRNRIAIWDVIHSCKIIGSSDSSIQDVVANDLSEVLKQAPIKHIFANGTKAYELYQKYAFPQTKREIIKLPSTSSANAGYGLERLCEEWKCQINI